MVDWLLLKRIAGKLDRTFSLNDIARVQLGTTTPECRTGLISILR